MLSVSVSEFMASNESFEFDDDGATYDWIELFNAGDAPVNLEGWTLTDSASEPNKWTFPSIEIGSRAHLLIFASGTASQTEPLHTNFRLKASGEYLALRNAAGDVTHEFAPTYPPQFTDISYGFDSLLEAEGYSTQPTPGRANISAPYFPIAEVDASASSGVFTEPIEVSLESDEPNAIIRYTLDGTVPSDSNGFQYQSPIPVSETTILRAAALSGGLLSSTATFSYVFVDDVAAQSTESVKAQGFPETWNGRPVDYEMDPRVVGAAGQDQFGGKYRTELEASLKSIPSLSVVADADDLFGAEFGLYTNPTERGIDWERRASAELFDPTGNTLGFRVDAGLRIQGGVTRSATSKHGFRLIFRNEYGARLLNHPLYENNPVTEFNSLVLRPSSGERDRQIIRDANLRDTQRAMGHPSPHGRFLHLYLNGVYWGVYEMVERPDEYYMANYFGGSPDDWDVINAGDLGGETNTAVAGTLDAWETLVGLTQDIAAAESLSARAELFNRIQGRDETGRRDPELENYLDVDNYIDYLILQWYMKNTDWPARNFYLGRERGVESEGFKFVVWDGDFTVGSQGPSLFFRPDRFGEDDTLGPGVIFPGLFESELFRERFRQRVWLHTQPGAALYSDPESPDYNPAFPERNVPAHRYQQLSESIDSAIVAESARWGDGRLFGQSFRQLFTRDEVWRPRVQNTIEGFLNSRRDKYLTWLENADLHAPNLSPPAVPQLLITEIHYHPADPTPEESFELPDVDDNDFEYLEVWNAQDTPVDLTGLRFIDGIQFRFPHESLAPGEYAVVVADRDAFEFRYGTSARVLGEFELGRLSNQGETLRLVDAFGQDVRRFAYQDDEPWPESADGNGPSLELIQAIDIALEEIAVGQLSRPELWKASHQSIGTPGNENTNPQPIAPPGDSNRDGIFNSADLVLVFAAGRFETGEDATWEEGDWNDDGIFDTQDFVFAMAAGYSPI